MPRPLTDINAAMRSGDGEALITSLVASLTDNAESYAGDPRDVMMLLAPYEHAAQALGDPDVLIRAAKLCPAALGGTVAGFAGRSITPDSWDFEVVESPDGVPYRVESISAEDLALLREMDDYAEFKDQLEGLTGDN